MDVHKWITGYFLTMEKILVSACLLGVNCRYDGKNAYRKKVVALLKNNYVIFACPEQLGGLSTPRVRNEIKGKKVISDNGIDVTDNFYRGAREFVALAKMFGIKRLILKSKSPSCGKNGIVTQLLPKGLKVEYIK
ncbi:hypothetical protein ES705_08284 [subsurface metagenome]